MYQNLTLFPNSYKKSQKQPDYTVQASVKNSTGEWENFKVGSAWIRTLRNGTQVADISLNKEPFYKDNGDVIPAYCVVETDGMKKKLAPQQAVATGKLTPQNEVEDDGIPVINLDDEIVIDDVPF